MLVVSSDKRRRRNFSFSLGQPRKLSGLQARFISKPESSRAFSAHIRSNQKNPGVLPQAGNDTAPSVLNTYASGEANVALIV